jgi:flagellar biosynthesis protein FlhB
VSGEKTEKATPKKLQDLRKKGQVARSQEMSTAIGLIVAVVMLPGAVRRLSEVCSVAMAGALGTPPEDEGAALRTAAQMFGGTASALGPLLAALAVATVAGAATVHRSAPNLKVLRAKKERVSPKNSIKRMFSAQVPFELTRSVVKLSLLAAVAWSAWKAGYAGLLSGPGSLDAFLGIVGRSIATMLVNISLLALVVGVIDAWWSRRRFNKQAKMSVNDVKDEHKTSDGNPHMKGAMRARASKLSRNRMMAAIAGADVVLANPTHLVVALTYAPGSAAPVVVAKAAGNAADRVKAEAALHEVPVVSDKPLARALYRATEIGDPVPIELYRAVAEVLAAVYSTRTSRSRA